MPGLRADHRNPEDYDLDEIVDDCCAYHPEKGFTLSQDVNIEYLWQVVEFHRRSDRS